MGSDGHRRFSDIARERIAQGIVGRGRALVGALLEACLAHGVTVLTGVRARRLILDGEAVAGVVAERAGAEVTYSAALGVVLASGGFEWNRELWDRFVGVPLDGPLSPPGNEGDGLLMALQAGAQVANLTEAWWMPGLAVPGETYDGHPRFRQGMVDKSLPGAIVVNRAGRRFVNEALNYDDYGKFAARWDPQRYEFPNYPAYVVGDSEHIRRYRLQLHDFDRARSPEWLTEAPTLRALAEQIGVEPDGLEATVDEFNRHAADNVDPVLHRGEEAWETYRGDRRLPNPVLRAVDQPPYFAYRLRVACFGTKGGPVIDEHGQVVRWDGAPVPGLYASGNVTASVFGPSYPGGGGTLGPAVTFGYLAGRAAVAAAAQR
jgi:succinate dehydrogenase/fumarate reductase flavoprotein subunit